MKKSEEVAFMNAHCYYLESPSYSLDATNTYKAIGELQYFIDKYPNSERVDKCNSLIDNLRDKLENKAFHNAKLYYDREDFSRFALNNVVNDFPDTDYREEAFFLILDLIIY